MLRFAFSKLWRAARCFRDTANRLGGVEESVQKGIVGAGLRFPPFEIAGRGAAVIFNFYFVFLIACPRLGGGERCWVWRRDARSNPACFLLVEQLGRSVPRRERKERHEGAQCFPSPAGAFGDVVAGLLARGRWR